jgi:hypothetical protein
MTRHEWLLSQGYRLESFRPEFKDRETGETDFYRRYYSPRPPDGFLQWHRILNSKADAEINDLEPDWSTICPDTK